MMKKERKNWWPEEILIATFLSNKNIKDKKRNKRGIYDLFHKKNKSNDEKKFIYYCTVSFKTDRTGLKVTYYGDESHGPRKLHSK